MSPRHPLPWAFAVAALFLLAACDREAAREARESRPPSSKKSVERVRAVIDPVRFAWRRRLAEVRELEPASAAARAACRVEGGQVGDVAFGRTALEPVNPEHAPESWMVPLLQDLRGRPRQDYALRFTRLADDRTGYIQPIWAERSCLQCHGREGLEEDDLLGAWWAEFDPRVKADDARAAPAGAQLAGRASKISRNSVSSAPRQSVDESPERTSTASRAGDTTVY